MRLHVLGVCGTFMAGVATLARDLGHRVSGSDEHAWPPMSEQLARSGIDVRKGYLPEHLEPAPDCVLIGNALSRGNPAVEHVLDHDLPYRSGPAWLAEHCLRGRWVLAVAGTHGKTTTSAALAFILERAGLDPGFLIGGAPANFTGSARLGGGRAFVVEADEYDTAFFDKRSKFVHYRPRTLAITNIEHDHADIFPDLDVILRQFNHLLRTVPGTGRIVHAADDPAVERLLEAGCWTPCEGFGSGGEWHVSALSRDWSRFAVHHGSARVAEVAWGLLGEHNARNALAALLAARHAGVEVPEGAAALADFRGVRRRLERIGDAHGIVIYDDFAHHPTAIAATLAALRAGGGARRVLAVLEPRSNTMRLGVHRDTLARALEAADAVWLYRPPELDWDPEAALRPLGARARVRERIEAIVEEVVAEARSGDHVAIMSNGDFQGLHARLLESVREAHGSTREATRPRAGVGRADRAGEDRAGEGRAGEGRG